jgi:hypothetical protein
MANDKQKVFKMVCHQSLGNRQSSIINFVQVPAETKAPAGTTAQPASQQPIINIVVPDTLLYKNYEPGKEYKITIE